ncbi:MAG: hypothetical protein K1X72_10370 [Pyrinomonadaceae bacterium]|nr:hypothetical protein [Pyrinomonadaceae bacterium]
MGRSRQPRPKHLARKLKDIRLKLGFSQFQMYEALANEQKTLYPGHITLFENDQRIPSLLVLLQYARLARVSMDILVDDAIELP